MCDVVDLRTHDIADTLAQREADMVRGSQGRAGTAGAKPREGRAEENEQIGKHGVGSSDWW